MEGSGRILTLFCAEKHQKLGTPGSRRRQGPLSAGQGSCGVRPGQGFRAEPGVRRGLRPQGRAESPKPSPAPLPQLSSPAASEPERLAQPVTSSRKSRFSCGRAQSSSTNGVGLGHAIGSPEPSPAEHKTEALCSPSSGSGGPPATPSLPRLERHLSALAQGLRWRLALKPPGSRPPGQP